MFQVTRKRSIWLAAASILALIYHCCVHSVRSTNGSAVMALVLAMSQAVIMVMFFFVFFWIMGAKGAGLRGDFLIYIMTGIFLYISHVRAVGAVSKNTPFQAILLHSPMTTIVQICASALSVLYLQIISVLVILSVYYVMGNRFELLDPIGCLAMLVLAWFSGVAVGLVLAAMMPWAPGWVSLISMIYQRASMIASGKMFVANVLPGFMLEMFDWNPLFHIIDQCRGYAFINYQPRYTNWEYAFWVSVALLMLGLLGEHYSRKHASASWNARR